MTAFTVGLLCAEWGATIKTTLIVAVSITLAAVIALLVLEIIGRFKKENFETAVKSDSAEPEKELEKDKNEPEAEQPQNEAVERAEDSAPVSESEDGDEEISAKAESVELAEGAVLVDDDENVDAGTMIVGEQYLKVRYNRSFEAKLIQSDDMFKGRYNALANELLRYGLKRRSSWGNESWYKGRNTFVKFAVRGKTLSAFIALDPEDFEGTKYVFKNVRDIAKYRDVPMQVKCKSERAVRWIKELFAELAAKYDLPRNDVAEKNMRPDYRDTASLVREGLIKLYCVATDRVTREQMQEAAAADLKARDKTPRDFTTKLMRADSVLKSRYSEIKNELLRYGMRSRMSAANESWYKGRITYVKFAIRGKTLSVYLALDPKEFEGTKYNFNNMGTVGKYETVPMRVKLKSDRSVRWLKELIATLAEKKGWERSALEEQDYRYVDNKSKTKKRAKKPHETDK